MKKRVILIPVQGSEEAVEVPINDLPKDPNELVDILKAETAPLTIWLKCAVEYYKQGHVDGFLTILKIFANDSMVPSVYREQKHERIAILNALAAFYTQQAKAEKDPKKREELLKVQVTTLYNMADKLDMQAETTWVTKGFTRLVRGEFDQALKQFETVLEHNPRNIPAQLGKACVNMNRGQYREALVQYAQLLAQIGSLPDLSASDLQLLDVNDTTFLSRKLRCICTVLQGLGLAWYRLAFTEGQKVSLTSPQLQSQTLQLYMHTAREAFNRIKRLLPQHPHVHAFLGVLDLAQASRPRLDAVAAAKYTQSALQSLKRAYEVNPTHALALNHLVNHFFNKKEYDKATNLALTAYHNTTVPKLQALSFYNLGRNYHAQEDYDNAFQYYFQAVQLWPDFILPRYGLGQMYLHRKETDKAIEAFERVLTVVPDNYETLKILGSLYLETNKLDKAYACLTRVTELYPDDIDTLVDLASLFERSDFSKSLLTYQKIVALLTKQKREIPLELWNNIGVLKHEMGDYSGAEEAFQQALGTAFGTPEQYQPRYVTVTYNLARLYEDRHQYKKAETLYKNILKEYPSYLDCYIRLGKISLSQGEVHEASEWYKETLAVSPQDVGAWTLLANLHLEQSELYPAQKKFERLLAQDRHDEYALLQLANIFLIAARHVDPKTPDKDAQNKRTKYLGLAQEYFTKLLARSPYNVYAANGLGIVCAEKGLWSVAHDFFQTIREQLITRKHAVPSNPFDFPDVHLNLAHIYLHTGHYGHAIALYETVLAKFYENKDVNVLLYLAKAYFEAGQLEACKAALRRAIHLAPWNLDLWYNLAVVNKDFAIRVLNYKGTVGNAGAPSSKELRGAIQSLQTAQQIFQHLSSLSKNTGAHRRMFSTTRCQTLAKLCSTNSEILTQRLKATEEWEHEVEIRRQQKQEEVRRLQEERRKREEEAQLAEQRRRAQLEQEALEVQRQTQLLAQAWKQREVQQVNTEKTKKGKKSKKKTEEDEMEVDEAQSTSEQKESEHVASKEDEQNEDERQDVASATSAAIPSESVTDEAEARAKALADLVRRRQASAQGNRPQQLGTDTEENDAPLEIVDSPHRATSPSTSHKHKKEKKHKKETHHKEKKHKRDSNNTVKEKKRKRDKSDEGMVGEGNDDFVDEPSPKKHRQLHAQEDNQSQTTATATNLSPQISPESGISSSPTVLASQPPQSQEATHPPTNETATSFEVVKELEQQKTPN